MNKWLGHRLVEFGTEGCGECGNERLRHLHRINTEDRGEIEVGCVCAAKLCPSDQQSITQAEKQMDRDDQRLRKLKALQDSWTVHKQRKTVQRVTGSYDGAEVTVYWDLGRGFTVKLPRAPINPASDGYKAIQQWVETYYATRGTQHG